MVNFWNSFKIRGIILFFCEFFEKNFQLMHSLGFWHEHSRAGRPRKFLKKLFRNNFQTVTTTSSSAGRTSCPAWTPSSTLSPPPSRTPWASPTTTGPENFGKNWFFLEENSANFLQMRFLVGKLGLEFGKNWIFRPKSEKKCYMSAICFEPSKNPKFIEIFSKILQVHHALRVLCIQPERAQHAGGRGGRGKYRGCATGAWYCNHSLQRQTGITVTLIIRAIRTVWRWPKRS